MAKGDTKTQQYLDIAARGNRSALPTDNCCNTRTQNLIVDVARRIITEEETRAAADQVLQGEIDEIRNNPDVVDIVATYAALQAYDTSHLTDNDVIRVLADETHSGASTYYRWSTTTETFTYIGETGDYYTKGQVDNLIAEAPAFKPYPSTVNTIGTTAQFIASIQALNPEVGMAYLGTVELSDLPASLIQEEVETYVYDNNLIYCILRSADTSPYMWWCNSYDYRGWEPMGGGPTVVQTTGTSTTDVMSQNATTSLVYADPGATRKIQIGYSANVTQVQSAAIGDNASCTASGGVALGAYSNCSSVGVVSINTSIPSLGYNNSYYRLLKGLYDPQSDHDAATKGYVDTAVASAGASEINSTDWSNLWQ